MKPNEPLTQLGRYQLNRVIGRCEMGLVFQGLDPRLERPLAVKTILKSHMLDETMAGEYSARFKHDVYFDLPQAVPIMGELLDALGYAHEHGIVQRDVKPANAMIETSGRVTLTDFGVARLARANVDRTTPGTMVSTPSCMSPEQIQGPAIGSRTDLSAAGAHRARHRPCRLRSSLLLRLSWLRCCSAPSPGSSCPAQAGRRLLRLRQPKRRFAPARQRRNRPPPRRPSLRPTTACRRTKACRCP